jgi:hypothetical protein
MTDLSHDECAESYQACMASRRERLLRIMQDNPGASNRAIARLADASIKTVEQLNAHNRDAVTPVILRR